MSEFRFKQFTVQQKESAAKITTDATILAAWAPLKSKEHILEVGAGTGVISLMLAQRFPATIKAVEINPRAFVEAKQNFQNSPWHNRMEIIQTDFSDFTSESPHDAIISNPPFFTNNLQSEINEAKNMAYHTDYLSFKRLAEGIARNLTSKGEAFIMLPVYEMSLFEQEMEACGFMPFHRLQIHHNLHKQALRVITAFSRIEKPVVKDEKLYIKNPDGSFHQDYQTLLQDFLTIF